MAFAKLSFAALAYHSRLAPNFAVRLGPPRRTRQAGSWRRRCQARRPSRTKLSLLRRSRSTPVPLALHRPSSNHEPEDHRPPRPFRTMPVLSRDFSGHPSRIRTPSQLRSWRPHAHDRHSRKCRMASRCLLLADKTGPTGTSGLDRSG